MLTDSSQKLTPSLFHQLKYVNKILWRFKSGDFNLKDKERSSQSKMFEDAELQALLDENSARKLKELAEALNVGKSIVSNHLHVLEKIKKKGQMGSTWLSELTI